MKRLLHQSFAMLGLCFVTGSMTAAPQARIDISDDNPTQIYAVSAGSTKGVYTLSTTDETVNKISGSSSTCVQYSFANSGGTFVSKDKLYGTYSSGSGWLASYYAIIATADGKGDGPWSHTYFDYKNESGTKYTTLIVAKDMTYVAGEDKIYGLFRADAFDESKWCLATYDGETFTVNKIGDFPAYTILNAIAADAGGELYAINATEAKLVKIDKSTAEITEVGPLGVTATGTNQSAAIDPATGKMYWVAGLNAYSSTQSMYEVDLATGAATKLYDFTTGCYSGLWIPAPDTNKAAPAAVENLTATFSGSGNDVNVNFTLPSKTFGGSTLQGELEYTVTVDGETAATGNGTAGSDVNLTIQMTDGQHKVNVVCTNSVGEGAKASTEVFAGFDTPLNITDIMLELEGNKATLSWTAPLSANGGMLDDSKLSYTVTRNPGNVIVAEGLKECTATDEIPDGLYTEYSWTVTVKYTGTDDQSLSTPSTMSGKPYTVPYKQDFSDVTTLGQAGFVQANANASSPGWTIGQADGNTFAEVEAKYYFNHDDYLFTAPVEMKAGITYTLKFSVGANAAAQKYWDWSSGTGVEKLRTLDMTVSVTTNNDSAPENLVQPELLALEYEATDENAGQFTQYSTEFTVDADGVYYIAFFDKSSYYHQNIALRVDDIEITAIYPTPDAVSGLSAAPAEKGSRDIVLEFTTPDKDVNGNPLASLSAIEIYRGTDLIATLTDTEEIAPASDVKYTDENAPRGFNAYSVVARNGDFASARATVSVMSGLLNDLAVTDVSAPEFIRIDGSEEFKVTVFNDGAETALDYRVVLLEDGVEFDAIQGETIHTDESITYTFTINWKTTESEETGCEYSAMVEFYGDEKPENNTSEAYPVKFEYKETDSVSGIDSSAVKVSALNGCLTVYGAEGMEITVYSLDGRPVSSSTSHGNTFSLNLESGIYVTVVAGNAYKVVL